MRTADVVLTLRMTEGPAGYGVYCMLLELLRDAEGRKLVTNPKNLAFALNVTDVDLVDRVLHSPGLFTLGEDGTFSSPWLDLVLSEFDAKKEAAREAGRKGAAVRYGNKQPYSNPMGGAVGSPKATHTNTPIQETKENENNKPIQSRSKLYELSWGEYKGEDLFRLARGVRTELSDLQYEDAICACDTYKKRGAAGFDPLFVFEACKTLGLSAEVYDFLVKITTYGSDRSPATRRLREIVAAWTTPNAKERFRPNYPADYVLTQLVPIA